MKRWRRHHVGSQSHVSNGKRKVVVICLKSQLTAFTIKFIVPALYSEVGILISPSKVSHLTIKVTSN